MEKIPCFLSNFPALLYSPAKCSPHSIVQVKKMEIRHTMSPGIVIVTLAGWLDTASSGAFLEYCATLPAVPVILDFSELIYLSSTGLRALLRFRRERTREGAEVVISGSRGFTHAVLRMSRFDRFFRSYPSVADAVEAIAKIASPATAARVSA